MASHGLPANEARTFVVRGVRRFGGYAAVLYTLKRSPAPGKPRLEVVGTVVVQSTVWGWWKSVGSSSSAWWPLPPVAVMSTAGPGYRVVFGRATSPRVVQIDVRFSNGRTFHDVVAHGGYFALISTAAADPCDLHARNAVGVVVEHVVLSVRCG